MHIRALANALDGMHDARRLSSRWHLVLTVSGAENPDTTFSLEPESPPAENSLMALQNDLRSIANDLTRYFWAACDSLVEK